NASDLYQHAEQRRAFSEKMVRDGAVMAEELELKTLKGRRFWGAVTAICRRDEKGNVYFDGII
ncbi:MAG: hypothetical protein GWN87_19645, partial [Desulfuromonadales bacterium]|nr:hypothetical protein [Desulfuromonadales bacterium]